MKFTPAFFIPAFSIILITLNSCKKEEIPVQETLAQLEGEVLNDFANKTVAANYSDLSSNANQLNNLVQTFCLNPNDSLLNLCRDAWRSTRKTWELSEAFLFGPVEDYNYDPTIDDWPVNQIDLDSVLAGSTPLQATDIVNFPTSLKGFHPIEYLIFGAYGNKSSNQFTPRELEYLTSLSGNLASVAFNLNYSWSLNNPDNYRIQLINAGPTSERFATRKDAFITIVNAMAAICDEVANGKLEEPFVNQDSLLEESHFSHNSLEDFKNNIRGVQNVYLGSYMNDYNGLDLLVSKENRELDLQIKTKLDEAITSFQSINSNYGLAIYTQPIQIMNCQTKINELKDLLEDELTLFIVEKIKD